MTLARPLLLALVVLVTGSFTPPGEWTSLLDPELSRWDRYLSFRHQPGYSGEAPRDAAGNLIAPIGYNRDEHGVFTTHQEDGETVLRVSGEIYGSLFTREAFANYHLKLQVRWGDRKWTPRTDLLRDSGLLYHSIGESGVDYWRSWKLSQEFQIMEGHMGDYWNIGSSAIDIRAFIPEGDMNPVASARQPFIPIGAGARYGGFCLRSADHETPDGGWTELELITVGDRSLHIVNGHVVMILKGSRYLDGDAAVPLTEGAIQLQSEGAETFFRRVMIRPLREMPAEYAALFE